MGACLRRIGEWERVHDGRIAVGACPRKRDAYIGVYAVRSVWGSISEGRMIRKEIKGVCDWALHRALGRGREHGAPEISDESAVMISRQAGALVYVCVCAFMSVWVYVCTCLCVRLRLFVLLFVCLLACFCRYKAPSCMFTPLLKMDSGSDPAR